MQTDNNTLFTSVSAKEDQESFDDSMPIVLQRRIGSIVYEVEVHFNPDAKERMDDTILRLIRRDLEAAS